MFKLNFYCYNGGFFSNISIWLNVVGQVVTDIENDEVGSAVMESDERLFVITKKRDSFLSSGIFTYQFTDGELDKSQYFSEINQIRDAQISNSGNLFFLGDNSLLKIDNTEGFLQVSSDMSFFRAHIQSNSQKEMLFLGTNTHTDKLILERRDQDGTLIKRKTVCSDYKMGLEDAILISDSLLLILKSDIMFLTNYGMDLVLANSKNGDYDYVDTSSFDEILGKWKDAGFINCSSGVVLYGFDLNNSFEIVKLKNNLSLDWKSDFSTDDKILFSDDNYICGECYENESCHDKRLWGWENNDGYVFLLHNQIIKVSKGSKEFEIKKIFDTESSFKIDWVSKSGDSVLLLANTKKVNEYGVYNKRFCTVFRMNLKGEFIDLY